MTYQDLMLKNLVDLGEVGVHRCLGWMKSQKPNLQVLWSSRKNILISSYSDISIIEEIKNFTSFLGGKSIFM